jgi:hypothetical protein
VCDLNIGKQYKKGIISFSKAQHTFLFGYNKNLVILFIKRYIFFCELSLLRSNLEEVTRFILALFFEENL